MTDERKTELRNLMNLAWLFFRKGSGEFSDSLRKAWRNDRLENSMRKGEVCFTYMKTDGSVRTAVGTMEERFMSGYVCHSGKPRRDDVQVFYDVEKKKFKSFKKENLMCQPLS